MRKYPKQQLSDIKEKRISTLPHPQHPEEFEVSRRVDVGVVRPFEDSPEQGVIGLKSKSLVTARSESGTQIRALQRDYNEEDIAGEALLMSIHDRAMKERKRIYRSIEREDICNAAFASYTQVERIWIIDYSVFMLLRFEIFLLRFIP